MSAICFRRRSAVFSRAEIVAFLLRRASSHSAMCLSLLPSFRSKAARGTLSRRCLIIFSTPPCSRTHAMASRSSGGSASYGESATIASCSRSIWSAMLPSVSYKS